MAEYSDGSVAFALRQAFKDDFDEEPIENGGSGFGLFEMVGHGKVTNDDCGKFSSTYGCLNGDLHGEFRFPDVGSRRFGLGFKDKGYFRRVFHSCDKPSCPICFKSGWAVREAGNIEARLAVASKRFGLVEHVIVAVPPKCFGLEYEDLRRKAGEVLFSRGVVGGVLIFHGFRFNVGRGWYWSPHFHVLGFVYGGYACRGCVRCEKGCGEFVDKNYRLNEKDGWYVKVKGKRKTVGGTAWYQLNHASVVKASNRFHVATWFGVCSYRKLKITKDVKRHVCPICGHDLVKVSYVGRECLEGKGREFVDDLFDERGVERWVLRE